MNRRVVLAVLFCVFFASPRGVGASDGTERLHVPEGFVVERVAGPPLVEHPMTAGLDDRGRLFVAENAGVNLDFKQLQQDPPSKILLLEDTSGDGVFDRRTVFADKLTFPTGALWHDGALYVCSAPSVWRLIDTNGDDVADTREQIVTGFGSVGNAADLHGPFLGPEGWLYFCDGRNGHDLTLGDGTKWTGKAACVYRCRIDGSGLEVVFGGGFDNPVEIAFTPEGEPLVNVNLIQSQPHRVDAIVYGIEGGNYPYNETWRELKRTGEFQPTVGDLGWVATSGFMRYRGHALGSSYEGKYFTTQFNPHRVQSHLAQREGAGFHVTHEDFLTCDDPDFHPTDILEDADGNLLVIDTGGWFRIGCPNSQIAKPDVKGAIYRVRRSDAARHADVRDTIQREQGSAADPRLAAMRLAALMRDPQSEGTFLAGLKDTNLAVRREAAIGLGHLRCDAAVPPLLDAAASAGGDRFLEHAVTFALIQIADRKATVEGLRHANPAARRAALIALDQMNGENVTVDLVTPHLASDFMPLRATALAIAAEHADWAWQVAPTIRAALAKPDLDERDAESIRAAVSAYARAAPIQSLVTELLDTRETPADVRVLLLRSASESSVVPLPAQWVEPLRRALGDADERVVTQAVELIRGSGADAFDADLSALARDPAVPAPLRVAALGATLPRAAALETVDFDLLRSELSPGRAPLARLNAAQTLSAAPVSDAQLREVARIVASAGPLELPALLASFERSADAEVGAALLESLAKAKSLAGVTPAGLAHVLAKYPPAVQQSAAPLLAKINPDAAAQAARLAELTPLLTGGDPSRGQSIFFGKTVACTACHAVNGTGAAVGPDLSKIASIRSGPDLLESIVFPSASFARGYEPFVVQTQSNQVLAGVLAAETPEAIVLRTPAEVRIPRSSVKSIRQDRVSIMPQGLDAQLRREELADLLAFLQSLK